MKSKDPTNPLDVIIAHNVKSARIARGLTQATLAEALGLTFQQVQKYESGKNRISASRLVEIARILEMNVAALLPALSQAPSELPELSRQSARLVQLFDSIPNDSMRETILSIVKQLATRRPSPAKPALRPWMRTTQSRRAG